MNRGLLSLADSHPPIIDINVSVPESAGFGPHAGDMEGTPRTLKTDVAVKVLRRWKFERETYPGWLVTPERKRSELWEMTRPWLGPLMTFAKGWAASDRLIVFREINWRLEAIMAPLSADLIEPLQSTIDEVFDSLAQGQSLSASAEIPGDIFASGTEVADAWLEIAFGLLRDARESYDEARWNALKGRIDKVIHHHQRYIDRSQYEAVLQAIWNVDRASAKAILSKWQPSGRVPLAMMWKAGLLAELEDPGEARTLLRSALSRDKKVAP